MLSYWYCLPEMMPLAEVYTYHQYERDILLTFALAYGLEEGLLGSRSGELHPTKLSEDYSCCIPLGVLGFTHLGHRRSSLE